MQLDPIHGSDKFELQPYQALVVISEWVTGALPAIHRVKATWLVRRFISVEAAGHRVDFCLVIVSTPEPPIMSR